MSFQHEHRQRPRAQPERGAWPAIIFFVSLMLLLGGILATAGASSAAGGVSAASGAPAGGEALPRRGPPEFERVLLKARPGVSEDRVQRLIQENKGRAVGRIDAIGVHVIEVPAHAAEAVVRAMNRRIEIEFAEVDEWLEPEEALPNDPRYKDAWHLPKIDTPLAWTMAKGDGVVVAVLDTGVQTSHPDYVGKLVPGWNTVTSKSNDVNDVHGHGTRVSGSIGAATDNAEGIAAVGWNARLMPIRITDDNGNGSRVSDFANGLVWAADNGAHVASISYIAWPYSSVQSAARYLRGKGGLVFSSAGNGGTDLGHAATPDIIVVAATSSSDSRASWSNFGKYIDIAAPGVSILTTNLWSGYTTGSGTSHAAPVAAAVAALVMSANPELAPAQIEQILFESAEDLGAAGWDPLFGWGRVNAGRAVSMAWSSETDRQAPEVSFLTPGQDSQVSGETLVKVAAEDNTEVATVELFANGRKIGIANKAPFEFFWDTSQEGEGTVRLLAEAKDSSGNKASAGVDVKVKHESDAPAADTEAPLVKITAPGEGSVVSGTVKVAVNATDNVGVTQVDLYAGDTLVGSRTSTPFEFTWDTTGAPEGTVSLQASARDAAGNIGTHAVSVIVKNAADLDDEAPMVRITSPADGEQVSGVVRLEATATDNVGVVAMSLSLNGQTMCTSSSGSVSCNWQSRHSRDGEYVIAARATDAAGNEGTTSITVRIGSTSTDTGDDSSTVDESSGPPPGRGWRK